MHQLLCRDWLIREQCIQIDVAQSSSYRVGNSDVTCFHGIEKLPDLTPHTFFFTAHARDRKKSAQTRILDRNVLRYVNQWTNQPHASLLRPGYRRKRGDSSVEQNV